MGKGLRTGKGGGERRIHGRSGGEWAERGWKEAKGRRRARGAGRGAGREGKARPRGMCLVRVPAAPPRSTRRRSPVRARVAPCK